MDSALLARWWQRFGEEGASRTQGGWLKRNMVNPLGMGAKGGGWNQKRDFGDMERLIEAILISCFRLDARKMSFFPFLCVSCDYVNVSFLGRPLGGRLHLVGALAKIVFDTIPKARAVQK